MRTKRFSEMAEFKPEPPAITDEPIAAKIASALFDDINMDDVYWTPDERETVVNAMASMIIKRGSALDVIYHCHRAQPSIDDQGNRGHFPFGYDGLSEYPNAMINAIVDGVMQIELAAFNERYGT